MESNKPRFDVYDDDDKLILENKTSAEICKELGCTSSNISNAIKNSYLLLKKYAVVYAGHKLYHTRIKERREEDIVYEHLLIYGNTIVAKEPERMCEEMSKRGLDVTWSEVQFVKNRPGENGSVCDLPTLYKLEVSDEL